MNLDGNKWFLDRYLEEQDKPIPCESCGELYDNEELDPDGWCSACNADEEETQTVYICTTDYDRGGLIHDN